MNTQVLPHDNGAIAYDDTGHGPLVICVPGMGDLRGEYRFLVPQLVAAGYRVVTMDVRGHGETTPAWPDYSVGAIGRDVLALIRALAAGPAIIIGTSMAAGAAVWAAAEAPTLVAGLVLIGPFVQGGGGWASNLLYTALFRRPWGPALWRWYYGTLYPTRKPADFADYTAALAANLRAPGRQEALLQMLRAAKAASAERLPRVTAPALVVMGGKDPDFKDPVAEARTVAESVRGRWVMVADAGHYPHAEFPEVTGPLLIDFLQSLHKPEKQPHGA
jgi:pimeloyl-ACP methyl ester carboxylesterase